MHDAATQELAVVLLDLAWLAPRTIGVERDPATLLPGTELEVMRLLVRRPALSVNQVAQGLRLQSTNVSTTVRSLIERGLIERRRDEHDRRVARLYPTSQALANREEHEAAWGGALDRVLAGLAPADAKRLLAVAPALRALAGSLGRAA
jgi:DNA-binding MarR family transcriptional regulator